jgi:hypothetical protein
MHTPFAKPAHAFFQVPFRLELGVRHSLHADIRKRMSNKSGQLLWEFEERVVSTLYQLCVLLQSAIKSCEGSMGWDGFCEP